MSAAPSASPILLAYLNGARAARTLALRVTDPAERERHRRRARWYLREARYERDRHHAE